MTTGSVYQDQKNRLAELKTRIEELDAKGDRITDREIDEYANSVDEAKRLVSNLRKLENGESIDTYVRGGTRTPGASGDGGFSASKASNLFGSAGKMFQAIAAAHAEPGRRIGEFEGGQVDPRLREVQAAATGGSIGVPSEGGFLVGEELSGELLGSAFETGILASRVRRRTLTGPVNRYRANAYDETSRADGSRYGGIRAYWTGEAESITSSKPKFRQIDLELGKLTGLYYATDELLQDAAALDQEIRDAFASEFGFKIDDAILNGDGAGKPLGILNSPALVTQDKESGQTADTIVTANILSMYSRWLGRRSDGVWVTNRNTFPQLGTLSVDTGTGGASVGLLGNDVSQGPNQRLLNMTLLEMEQAATLGDLGDLMLLDPRQYVWVDKGGVQSAVSIHVKFVEDEVVYRFIYRCDGQPIPASAVTPFKGALNRSPFVTLQART